MRLYRSLFVFWVALCVLLLFPAGAPAQTLQNGAVRGTVYDSTHAPVPGVKLTLTSNATGITRALTTDANGDYDFENVAPGTYQISAELSGFATTTVKQIVVNVGVAVPVDVTLPVKGQTQTVEVTASSNAAIVDTSTSGVTQLVDTNDVENLPFPGRDYRDLAQLSPTVQVVPGLRGGIRMGGQQSDYSGLEIDGADMVDNFFGENFGSLETKNLTIPLEAVQEFQVVTNGFAPEFGRATGGLLNVVSKSGGNQLHGEAHEYYRGGSLTANDALGNPSNINNQNQFGGSAGFPIRKDRQFLFVSTDIQREDGPLKTVFCPPTAPNFTACEASLQTAGPVIQPADPTTGQVLPAACGGASAVGKNLLPACYGVPNLAAFEGSHTQYQNFFTLLGHYDYQFSPANHFSIVGIGTRNHTNGFTGGQGQTETFDAIGNTENFINQGIAGTFALTTVLGRKVNEIRVEVSGETRKRHAIQSNVPEIQISGVGNFGQRFYLPANNDAGKLQVQDNFSYSFGKHDMKFGGDVDSFADRKDVFAGWSAGEYNFTTVNDFNNYNYNEFIQGFGLDGKNVFQANLLFPNYQTGLGLYWQDKWQVSPNITLTYGLRWDGTWNPQPQTPLPGAQVWVGQGADSKIAPVPQRTPNDFGQFGPRVGFAWQVTGGNHPTVVRAAWGYYYAQIPTIFFPQASNGGGSIAAQLFCVVSFFCNIPQTPAFPAPPTLSGFPYLFPSSLPFGVDQLCKSLEGCPSITYSDPSLRNPRVSNLTVGVEHSFSNSWTVSANYVFVHSTRLRTGGFSTTIWGRNFVPANGAAPGTAASEDPLGRTILAATPGGTCATNGGTIFPGALPLDCTLFSDTALASFSHGNYHEFVAALNKRFSNRYQMFANYTWSRNYSNASSERDTDSFFGPQDPFNLNLDYGRDGLDMEHQFKAGMVADLPWGFTWSNNFIAHSGLAYPAYILTDVNGDGVTNQGFGTNDRPAVQIGSGKPFLLPDYPGREPSYFGWDMRISKDINFSERYQLRLSADLFNVTNRGNLYSNPDHSAFVDYYQSPLVDPTSPCTFYPNSISLNCPPLTSLPKVGQASSQFGTSYRTLDELSPGATPFAAQFGVRFQF